MKKVIVRATLFVLLIANSTHALITRQEHEEAQRRVQILRETLREGEFSETVPSTVLNELKEYLKAKEVCKVFLAFVTRVQTPQYKELNKSLYDICMKKELDELQKY